MNTEAKRRENRNPKNNNTKYLKHLNTSRFQFHNQEGDSKHLKNTYGWGPQEAKLLVTQSS